MKIIVDNIIRIIDAEPIIEKYCKSNLEIDNPQYAQNERLDFQLIIFQEDYIGMKNMEMTIYYLLAVSKIFINFIQLKKIIH